MKQAKLSPLGKYITTVYNLESKRQQAMKRTWSISSASRLNRILIQHSDFVTQGISFCWHNLFPGQPTPAVLAIVINLAMATEPCSSL